MNKDTSGLNIRAGTPPTKVFESTVEGFCPLAVAGIVESSFFVRLKYFPNNGSMIPFLLKTEAKLFFFCSKHK